MVVEDVSASSPPQARRRHELQKKAENLTLEQSLSHATAHVDSRARRACYLPRVLIVRIAVLVFALLSPALLMASETPALPLAAQPRTAVIAVEGVDCAGCTVKIRKALSLLEGVSDVRGGAAKNEIVVDFDLARVGPKALVEAVKKAGFESSVTKLEKRA